MPLELDFALRHPWSMSPRNKLVIANLVSAFGFIIVGFMTGVAYLLIVGKVLGKGGDGFGLGAAVITFPILAALGSIVWIVFDLAYRRRMKVLNVKATMLYAAVLGLFMSLLIAGFRGFTMHGGSTLFNYFVIAFMLIGALQHRFLVSRIVGMDQSDAESR